MSTHKPTKTKPSDPFVALPIAQDSAFPLPTESNELPAGLFGPGASLGQFREDVPLPPASTEPVTTSSSPYPDTSNPQEEAVDAPRHEEWHVTVEGNPIAWWKFCYDEDEDGILGDIRVKPIFIELSNHQTQLMCAMTTDPSQPMHYEVKGARSFLSACADAGFTVIRIKHEVSVVRPGETALYYEAHVKLDGPFRVDRPGASRDLYQALGPSGRWYRTKRSRQPFDVQDFAERATSQSKPSVMIGMEYEACLLDTNPSLDLGWV